MEIMVGVMRRALMEKMIKGLFFFFFSLDWCAALTGTNNFSMVFRFFSQACFNLSTLIHVA